MRAYKTFLKTLSAYDDNFNIPLVLTRNSFLGLLEDYILNKEFSEEDINNIKKLLVSYFNKRYVFKQKSKAKKLHNLIKLVEVVSFVMLMEKSLVDISKGIRNVNQIPNLQDDLIIQDYITNLEIFMNSKSYGVYRGNKA